MSDNKKKKLVTTAKASDSLREKAMLATLSISRWTAIKEDKNVTAQVAKDNNADATMGRYLKRLVVKKALKAIQVTGYRARHFHYDTTLPWNDGGARLLPAAKYFDYMKRMKELEREFNREVAKFVSQYTSYVKEAKTKLGGLFNADEYPSDDEIGKLFKFAHHVEPLPNAEDFRVKLSEEELAEIRTNIEASINESLNNAVLGSWKRIHDQVKHLIDKLREYNPDDKIAAPFRDATITNVKELVALLPALNVTGSAELDAMAQRMNDELCQIEPATLREDAAAREDIAAKADAILKDVSDVLG